MSVRAYCTYFDRNFLVRGLALHGSLARHDPGSTLWVLCLDEVTRRVLDRMRLAGLATVSLPELEAADPDLARVRPARKPVEYYFTCTAAFVLHVWRRAPEAEIVSYADADLWFFASPEPIWRELGAGSVAIVPHRFPPRLVEREKYGKYNVGLVSFRRDDSALACLAWWRERCLEWCHDRPEPDRFADQKYLDRWPELFPGVVAIGHPGADLAPWNVEGHALSAAPRGGLLVDGQPLVFYHFHGLRRRWRFLYESGLDGYGVPMPGLLRRRAYRPYLAELGRCERRLRAVWPGYSWGANRRWARADLAALARAAGQGNVLLSG